MRIETQVGFATLPFSASEAQFYGGLRSPLLLHLWRTRSALADALDNGKENGSCYSILGLYRDNGKYHGNKWGVILGLYWDYMGIVEKKMETTGIIGFLLIDLSGLVLCVSVIRGTVVHWRMFFLGFIHDKFTGFCMQKRDISAGGFSDRPVQQTVAALRNFGRIDLYCTDSQAETATIFEQPAPPAFCIQSYCACEDTSRFPNAADLAWHCPSLERSAC